MKNNTNYYVGLNPLARVRAAQQSIIAARTAAAKARSAMVGECLPMPDGYHIDYAGDIRVTRIAVDVDGKDYGLADNVALVARSNQGSVADYWLADLTPDQMLSTVEAVEAGARDVVAALTQYAAQCQAESGRRLMEAAPKLAALTSTTDVAAALRAAADKMLTA